MAKTINDTTNKEAPKKNTGRLSVWDRIAAYRNLPKFFVIVWRTSRLLTFFSCFVRIIQAFLPLITLRVGKVIIDQVNLISRNRNMSQEHLWKFVVIEFLLVTLIMILSKVVGYIDDLLGELLTNHTNIMIMDHAATLDLTQFENSAFYDKLERSRQQSAARAQLLSQMFSQVQDFITMISFIVVLIAFKPWLILMLMAFFLPSIFGSAYFNAKTYLLVRSQTEGRRKLDYLSQVGCSDATAKEVRLFDLAEFLNTNIKRVSRISLHDQSA